MILNYKNLQFKSFIDDMNVFFLVNNNTYLNTHENNNTSVLNRVRNTLYNQNTTTKESNICS